MSEKDFVTWLRGFVSACHDFQPTPKQWELIKEVLADVQSGSYIIDLGPYNTLPKEKEVING